MENIYGLLAPVLRACVLTDEDPPQTPSETFAPLRTWVESQLLQAGHVVTLTDEILFVRLKDAAKELAQSAEDLPDARDLPSGYKQLSFIEHLLCEPPTLIRRLARNFGVKDNDIRDWISDAPSFPEAPALAVKLLSHLRDLCAEPEEPERTHADVPLRSFEDLKYLGNLRFVFGKLYGGGGPKQAQARYMPLILQKLDSAFFDQGNGNVVVVAPTNGGKNGMILVAALAAAAWDKGPTLVLQPYRAQIAESHRSWHEAAAGHPVKRRRTGITKGLRVAGSSALISDYDTDIVNGRIDITAIITEKLAVLSRNNRSKELSDFCRLLIADEIGSLLAEERGAKLEIMLTLAKVSGISLMATGAALSSRSAERIARWLGDVADGEDPRSRGVLLYDLELKRNPPIDYWVWRRDGRRRFWREGMQPLDSMEADTEPLPDNEEDAVSDLIVRELRESPKRQILVFMENRQRVLNLADNVARQLRGDSRLALSLSEVAADSGHLPLEDLWLGGSLPSPVDMPQILKQRVGVHTRDVPSNDLGKIEGAFRSGRLRVLCATTTVEAGINLPVDTVIQVGLVDHDNRRLSQRALEQRLGRSGRTISGREEPGKGIVYIHDTKQLIERVIKERIIRSDESSDSRLDEPYRALLLLSHLGSPNAKTKEDLEFVLGRSYWAFGRRADEIRNATDHAIQSLRREHLIEESAVPVAPGETTTISAWVPTPLGQALSAALLLPPDARAIERIVRVALEPVNESWLPEVLYAACLVPSIASANRRPREEDIISRPPMTRIAQLKAWLRPLSGNEFSFGFPKLKARMVGGKLLNELFSRLLVQRLRPQEEKALIRTYICWLWVRGDKIDVKSYIRNLNEHVVQQDLAYYMAHVLYAAAWLAQYEGKFIVSLRLKELSKEVELGAPIRSIQFFQVCQEHVSREQIISVKDYDFRRLLEFLEADVKDSLNYRLDVQRSKRHKNELRAALNSGVIENEDQEVIFDRMEDARDVYERLRQVWQEEEGGDLEMSDSEHVKAGRCSLHVVREELRENFYSDADIVISTRRLPEPLQLMRQPMRVSLIGSEEFVVLITRLAALSGDQQSDLLEALSRAKRVCWRDMIQALDSQLQAMDSLGQGGVRDRVEELVNSLSPLLESQVPPSGAKVAVGKDGTLHLAKDRLEKAAQLLFSHFDDQIRDRQIALDDDPDGGSLIRANLERLVSEREVLSQLVADVSSLRTIDEAKHLADALNNMGETSMKQFWRVVSF